MKRILIGKGGGDELALKNVDDDLDLFREGGACWRLECSIEMVCRD